jgi:hypothetical protein
VSELVAQPLEIADLTLDVGDPVWVILQACRLLQAIVRVAPLDHVRCVGSEVLAWFAIHPLAA